jgi:uncharacterized protein (TIGR00369 family)
VTEQIVRNPDFEAVVRGSFACQGLMAHLGARLAHVEPGHVAIEVPYRSELTQQQGIFHGGVTTTIADSACGYSALTLMAAGCEVLTVEFKINLLAPAQGERLIARGRVVKPGRTLTVCHGDVYAVSHEQETHCATMVATMMRIDLPGTSGR